MPEPSSRLWLKFVDNYTESVAKRAAESPLWAHDAFHSDFVTIAKGLFVIASEIAALREFLQGYVEHEKTQPAISGDDNPDASVGSNPVQS